MRILHLINHSARGNGNVHAAVDLACAQVRAGHDVVFASEGGSLDAVLRAAGVRIVMLPHNLRRPGLLGRHLIAACAKAVATRPDVIHAHMMSGAVVGYAAARLVGCPFVTTVHNSFDWHSRLMALGDTVVAVSEAERRTLLARGFAEARLSVVLNGPLGSPRYPKAEAAPVQPREKIIVSVSGLHPRKGVGDTLEAFGTIAPYCPDWRLLFVGEGPDMQNLVTRAAELGLVHQVEFLGLLDDPAPVLARAEIFVIASRAEPFGLAAVEARAAGCAIVATRVGGLPEVLGQGEAGILVDPDAPHQLAQALRGLIENPELRRRYQERARRGLDVFSTHRLMRDHEALYARLLGRRGKARRSHARNLAERVDAQES